ncbi:MAG: MFS transporter [Candidatus Riflebacteria bacterium]|nr:MFS transporter [Candidatus Riflebacteria bacterium]
MSDQNAPATTVLQHPPGFRPRRGLNWFTVGLAYASFYMCRYNLAIANKDICEEFHFSRQEFGYILTAFFWAYAVGQLINGLITDKIGGKRAMICGVFGTVVLNIAFGAASTAGMLSVFVLIRMLDGYTQAFGAPGMIKINASWFHKTERGTFAGIFGFMIQLGRFVINWLGPALLAGLSVWGLVTLPPLHWKYVFWVPAGIACVSAVLVAIFVKETPEEAGFKMAGEDSGPVDDTPVDVLHVLKVILSNRFVWVVAGAYFCTGVVRQGLDQWFTRYLQDVFSLDLKGSTYQWIAFMIPFVAVIGSLGSGMISDRFFGGQRAPVAVTLYFCQVAAILIGAQFQSLTAACISLTLISLTVNATHSILGTAAAMDIGGRKMAGFASGVIDSFQYFGAGLAGFALGKLLDWGGWGWWYYSMAPFGLIGGLLMMTMLGKQDIQVKSEGH